MGCHYNDGLRYSLVPLVIVSVSSITEYYDFESKCSNEYGINEIKRRWFKMR